MLAPLLALAMMSVPAADTELQVVTEQTFSQVTDGGLTYGLTIKAILPDGSHADLECGEQEKSCAEVQSLPPEKLPPKEQVCKDDSSKQMGYVHICEYKDVGTFRFERSGDKITIFHRNGKTTFKVSGSW